MELWGKNLKINPKKGKRKMKNLRIWSQKFLGNVISPPSRGKSSSTPNAGDQKHMRYDNNKNNRNYGQNKTEYSIPLRYGNNYKSTGSYGQRFDGQQKKGVSSFRSKPSRK